MDRIENYKALLQEAVCNIVADIPPQDGIRTEYVIDASRGHFEILETGWDGPRRVHGILFHCDVREGKIYVEHDGTGLGIADILVSQGVPHEDIILGYHPPAYRHLTPFAVA
jgi:hypothetical protein